MQLTAKQLQNENGLMAAIIEKNDIIVNQGQLLDQRDQEIAAQAQLLEARNKEISELKAKIADLSEGAAHAV